MINRSLVLKYTDTKEGTIQVAIKDCKVLEESWAEDRLIVADMDAILALNVLQQTNSATANGKYEASVIVTEGRDIDF